MYVCGMLLPSMSPVARCGWISMRIIPSDEMIRPNVEHRADRYLLETRRGARLGGGLVLEAQLFAELDFRRLLVEHQQARSGEHFGVGLGFQGFDERGAVLADEVRTSVRWSRRRIR